MKTVYHKFRTIYSTNTWALQNSALFDKEALTIVVAEEQSAGRGRLQRKWESPHGLNLYVTFCFFTPQERSDIANFPQILALSCVEVLEKLGLSLTLKWPNDVLCAGKKIAGILTETKLIGDLRFLAVAIGLNINMPKTLLDDITQPATSILVESGQEHSLEAIQTLLEEKFQENLAFFLKEGFAPFYESFKSHMAMNESLRFFDNQNLINAKISHLNPDGTLSLKLENGTIKTFCYGEIT